VDVGDVAGVSGYLLSPSSEFKCVGWVSFCVYVGFCFEKQWGDGAWGLASRLIRRGRRTGMQPQSVSKISCSDSDCSGSSSVSSSSGSGS
jgi:hypothetical protein